nr:MAG TPA: hypothetical protein [Caudoviricetes sp.]
MNIFFCTLMKEYSLKEVYKITRYVNYFEEKYRKVQ